MEYNEVDATRTNQKCGRCTDTKLVKDIKYMTLIEGSKKSEDFLRILDVKMNKIKTERLPDSFLVDSSRMVQIDQTRIAERSKKYGKSAFPMIETKTIVKIQSDEDNENSINPLIIKSVNYASMSSRNYEDWRNMIENLTKIENPNLYPVSDTPKIQQKGNFKELEQFSVKLDTGEIKKYSEITEEDQMKMSEKDFMVFFGR